MRYDVSKYITKTIMNNKKVILVEGIHDKVHLSNLLERLKIYDTVRIDIAESIKCDDPNIDKNNKSRILHIHSKIDGKANCSNLFLLCDREFEDFIFGAEILDQMPQHKRMGQLFWTIGHSFENYFFEANLITRAFRYLINCENKHAIEELFSRNIGSAHRIIATITLASRDIHNYQYASGTISWDHFSNNDGKLTFCIDSWLKLHEGKKGYDYAKSFADAYKKYMPTISATPPSTCARLSRGHTGIVMLQRIFAHCIHQILLTTDSDSSVAASKAKKFANHSEEAISGALSEAWTLLVTQEKANYPRDLICEVDVA